MESLEAHLAVLLHTSEDRTYVSVAWFNEVVIAANVISVIPGPSVQTFALLEVRPFAVWNKAIPRRLESRNSA